MSYQSALRQARAHHAFSLETAAIARRKQSRALEMDQDGFWLETHARCMAECRFIRGEIDRLSASGSLQGGGR